MMPPAARIGDLTPHPGAVGPPGAFNVLIGGQPAANMSSLHVCAMPPPAGPHPPSPFMPGSATVLIGGLPAVRIGDVSGCGAPILPPGCLTVLIG
jgi:uncharacterized Zn-binding protein involved in type VI secretion